jgi:hypothetical protein
MPDARRLLVLSLAFVAAAAIRAQDEPEPRLTERITDISPDGKYAMRIAYDAELNESLLAADGRRDPEQIDSETIYRVELVALPAGTPLLDLMAGEDNLGGGANFEGLTMLWSADSKWFAYYWTYPRVGYTTVYRWSGGKFQRMNEPERLAVPTDGDVRNEYIKPLRWLKPGTLELRQIRIYRGEDSADDALRFVARFDRPDKFKVVSKKPVPVTDE